MLQLAFSPDAMEHNRYYAVRKEAGLEPKIGWYLMLLIGVFLGSALSSCGDRSSISVPALWRWRFGSSVARRFLAAFLGGAIMVLGAQHCRWLHQRTWHQWDAAAGVAELGFH
jgi:hypothetical protein